MPTILDQQRTSSPVSNGYLIRASDFGVLPPGTTGTAFTAGGNLVASASGGSLATTTARVAVTYITALGESTISAEATVAVTGATGSVAVTVPANPQVAGNAQLSAQPIIGWMIYSSSGGAGTELRNNAGLTVALSTNAVGITYIPIATTSATIQVYGAGPAIPTVNSSGIQQPMPNIAASNSSDVFWLVNRTFTPFKMVSWIRPNSSADAGGLLVSLMDCVAPLWVINTAFAAGAFILVNNVVFLCTTAGTSFNGAIPAGLTTRPAKGTTVTDGTVVWTSQGERDLVRVRFSNTTGSAGVPVVQEYNLIQE